MPTLEQKIEELERNDVNGAAKLWIEAQSMIRAGDISEEEAGSVYEILAMLQDDPEKLDAAVDSLEGGEDIRSGGGD